MNYENVMYAQLILTGVTLLLALINVANMALDFVKAEGQPVKREKVLKTGVRHLWINVVTYVALSAAIAHFNGLPAW